MLVSRLRWQRGLDASPIHRPAQSSLWLACCRHPFAPAQAVHDSFHEQRLFVPQTPTGASGLTRTSQEVADSGADLPLPDPSSVWPLSLPPDPRGPCPSKAGSPRRSGGGVRCAGEELVDAPCSLALERRATLFQSSGRMRAVCELRKTQRIGTNSGKEGSEKISTQTGTYELCGIRRRSDRRIYTQAVTGSSPVAPTGASLQFSRRSVRLQILR